jgi:Gpi18-like mannosyltransferase
VKTRTGATVVNPPPDEIRSRFGRTASRILNAESWRAHSVYLSAMLIFAASRLVVIAGINFGKLLDIPYPEKFAVEPLWFERLLRWDSEWYADIIRHGYQYNDNPMVESSTVFYPLYPALSYAMKSLFGIDPSIALLVVANVSALVAALLMTKFVRDELGNEIALLSLAFLSFFPSSLFLSAGYSESLFLALVLLSFILMAAEKFVLASAAAGLSLATRSIGIAMIPVLFWEMGRHKTVPWARPLPKMVLSGMLAASGLLGYAGYLGLKFGRPLAFATSQAAWHEGTFLDRLVSALTLATVLDSTVWNAGWFLGFLALTLWSFLRLRLAVALYGLGALAVPYLTLGLTDSMNRYELVCFPAFICMGILGAGRPWLAISVIGIFAALLFQTAALFSQWHWVA